jgi:hypothetical protein
LTVDQELVMPGISTEYLAEQIEASNDRLTKAIDDLARKVEDGQKEFIQFRLDLTDKLSAIQNSLSWAKGIAVLVVLPVVFGVVAWSYKAADRAARIEESVIALRDHAKDQDARIAKLIELRDEKEKPPSRPLTVPTDPRGKDPMPPSGAASGDNRLDSPDSRNPTSIADLPPSGSGVRAHIDIPYTIHRTTADEVANGLIDRLSQSPSGPDS